MARTILVVGATGLVGRQLIQTLAGRSSEDRVLVLVRREFEAPTGIEQEVVDFDRLDEVDVGPVDVWCCALGTTIKIAGSKEQFYRVDHDLVVRTAAFAQRAGASVGAMVSAAQASIDSRIFYSRTKGETERDVAALGMGSLTILRPSIILGERARLGQPPRITETIAMRLSGSPFGHLIPAAYQGVPAASIARAMIVSIDAQRAGTKIIESASIRSF